MKNDPAPAKREALTGATLAVVLGSGLGEAGESFAVEERLGFDNVPGVEAAAYIEGHAGELKLCRVAGRRCVFVRGRRHYYEGHPAHIVAIIEYLATLGIRQLLVTSAAGSLSRAFPPGTLLLCDSILDLQHRPPPRGGATKQTAGPSTPHAAVRERACLAAFPSRVPNPAFQSAMLGAAKRARVTLGRGILACTAGSAYETKSEVMLLQRIGASAVSMSGAPEAAVAGELGIQIANLALLTNWATGISGKRLRHSDVLECGRHAASGLERLIVQLVAGG